MIAIETELISGQMASKMAAKVLAGFGGFFGYFAISATELSWDIKITFLSSSWIVDLILTYDYKQLQKCCGKFVNSLAGWPVKL